MCILFVHTNPKPGIGNYRLILATNRDEYFIRNAREAQKWPDNPSIISGVDLEPGREGGTWLGLGVNHTDDKKKGTVRIGALLNVTGEPRNAGAAGRGFIVTDYIKNVQNVTTEQHLKNLKSEGKKYNAFNFVALEVGDDRAQIFHYSNVENSEIIEYDPYSTLGFGNSLPQQPLSKVKSGQARFQEIVDKYNDVAHTEQLVSELISLLKWDQRHLPDEELKRRAPNAFEYLSSVYVHIPTAGYGTRTHTIILVDWIGEVQFIEHTMECPINADQPQWNKQNIKANL